MKQWTGVWDATKPLPACLQYEPFKKSIVGKKGKTKEGFKDLLIGKYTMLDKLLHGQPIGRITTHLARNGNVI